MTLDQDARAVLDAMREGINIIDRDGVIVFANRAYCEFLNREAGGDIGPIEGYKLRDLRRWGHLFCMRRGRRSRIFILSTCIPSTKRGS